MLKIISISILFLMIASANSVIAAKLYKWVDADGNISYQDTPPPEGSTLIKEEEIKASAPPSSPQTSRPTIAPRQQPVIVYTVPNCPSCELLLEKLQNWSVPASQESLQDRDVQARILAVSDSLSAPTLFIGGNLIIDLSDENLNVELQKGGYQITTSDDPETTAEQTESEN